MNDGMNNLPPGCTVAEASGEANGYEPWDDDEPKCAVCGCFAPCECE